MADLILAEQMLAYLVAQGIVRAGSTAGTLPPCWIEPLEGLQQPTDDDPLTAALFSGPEIAMPWLEYQMTQRPLKIVTRSRDWPSTEVLHRKVRAALEEKRWFLAGTLRVQMSKMAIGLQRIPDNDPTIYQATASYRIYAAASSYTV